MTYLGVTSCLAHKHNPFVDIPADTKKAVRSIKILDAQWSTCPIEVYDQVSQLWSWAELANDSCIFKTSIKELASMHGNKVDYDIPDVSRIIQYLTEQGVENTEEVWIHFWW